MGDRYFGHNACAIGTAKAILNLFQSVATPTQRPRICEVMVGCSATPADAAAKFSIVRTTALGTEDHGFVPQAIDPASSAAQSDFGCGAFSVEPTKTGYAELLVFTGNQRAAYRWIANLGWELVLPAIQNNGACLQSMESTVATAHLGAIYFEE